ncbi:MAG TPA: hypothetical protein PKC09_03295 [Paracoccus sp. (in: a-proteobacteria)]|uniref:ArsC/Spx/MgsR family protein n=1 Tax=uncultured Paracoccus sp. TaxID=189685 RepID=UPI00261F86D2|nr:ArsC/Spx/MgsR family protein [uncultured Paracoccus sp.]HMQ40273.1 hypothetical protein [Paracoccus sp. (in: a-proteobacteria)]HMR35243.1 hypothetical protein [Paracoccus sp. (in: a-proteobacteria)]
MSKTLKMYGLDYCSTVQKARKALEGAGWTVEFRDVKEDTPDKAEWTRMLDAFGEKLVNRASLTWRGMSEEERAAAPVAMLAAKPALMKRPAIEHDGQHFLGWTANVKRAFGIDP